MNTMSGENNNNNTLIGKINFYFAFLMILLYFAIGFMFLFTDVVIDSFPAYREIVGGLLIAYGSFRMYVLLKKNKKGE